MMKKNKAPSLPPDRTAPSVRERTLSHMEKILRNAQKLGAGIAFACGVMTQGCVVDPAVPPPPPPPGFCEGPDALRTHYYIYPYAHWAKPGRKWKIEVSLYSYGGDIVNFQGLRREDLHLTGASLQKIDLLPQQVNFVLTPAQDSDHAELDLPIRCEKNRVPLHFKLDISKPHKKKDWIPVEWVK